MIAENANLALLTGIPRSGTTLCCKLLNQYEDVLALVEPMSLDELDAIKDSSAATEKIAQFSRQAFAEALTGYAQSKLKGGDLADNIIAEKNTSASLRKVQASLGKVSLDVPLTSQGKLIIKHNALFAALLPDLRSKFEVYALIRNPLSVLASWQTVDLPVNRGRVPAGERFSAELRESLDAEKNVLKRQIIILNWFYRQYKQLVLVDHIIRYEQIVSGDRSPLNAIVGRTLKPDRFESVQSQNKNYDKDLMATLGQELLLAGGDYTEFYSLEDIKDLMP